MMIFFATCGRGMESFVKKELGETENVCKSVSVSEGKVVFCLCKIEKEANSSQPILDELNKLFDDNQTCISNLEKFNRCCQECTRPLKSPADFKVLFNLKMVEKIYYLLYLKTISNLEDIPKLSGSLCDKFCKLDFTSAMDIITNIKSQHTKSEWKMCINPDQCYAYINRQKEKEKIRSKRKLEKTKFEENVIAGMSNDNIKYSRPNIDAGNKSNTFRVSCRIRGKWKKYSSSIPFAKAVSEHVIEEKKWILHNNSPDLDIYINMNDECIIVGASLTDKPLSLRPYMSHITLRSTICHIIVEASKIMQGFTVLDPMCGSGSILLEAAMCIKELNIIACDIDSNTLLSAQCNLREIGQASIILSDTSSIPLLSNSVDAVICDFPFGQKHTTSKPYQSLLIKMIRESRRVLRPSSRLVILVSTVQHIFLKNNIHQVPGIELLDNYPVSLGLTPAIVMVFQVE